MTSTDEAESGAGVSAQRSQGANHGRLPGLSRLRSCQRAIHTLLTPCTYVSSGMSGCIILPSCIVSTVLETAKASYTRCWALPVLKFTVGYMVPILCPCVVIRCMFRTESLNLVVTNPWGLEELSGQGFVRINVVFYSIIASLIVPLYTCTNFNDSCACTGNAEACHNICGRQGCGHAAPTE